MKPALLWTTGLAGSLAAHAALAAVLALSVDPAPVEPQRPAEAQLSLASYQVPQDHAAAADAGGEVATEAAADGTAAAQGAVPQSRAEAAALPGQALGATTPDTNIATAIDSTAEPAAAAAPNAPAVTAAPASATAVVAVEDTATAVSAASPETATAQPGLLSADPAQTAEPAPAAPVASLALPATTASATAALSATPAAAARPQAAVAVAAPVAAATLIAAAAPSTSVTPTAPPAGTSAPVSEAVAPPAPAAALPSATVTPAAATGTPAADLPPPASFATAALAWSGGDQASLDPASLAAIEAFMQPGDASAAAQEARDGIEGLLAAVPCARLQTEFLPGSGALELRGHIPDEGMRAPVLAALQGEVGSSLPVTDNLLILPRPQCGALAGIADVGLPQSTDQLTNPRILGDDAHAREFRFAQGDPFVLEMVAPEYPAYVYIDYFDADGNVLHLVPNDFIALETHAPDQSFPVAEALNITIGPPYGQEIAVAFAASRPLYEGLRPIQEPAEPYLAWLKERVREARETDPDFKGEWVYFFVTTRANR